MIRPFRHDDLQAMVDITIQAFDGVSIDQNVERRYGPIHGIGWQERKARHIEIDAAANPHGIFVFDTDGAVVGYITCRFDHRTRIGWIPNLAVHPDHQGKGIGRQLMDAALTYLRGVGMKYARIETLEQNTRCMQLYPGLGFQEVGRQVHFIRPLD